MRQRCHEGRTASAGETESWDCFMLKRAEKLNKINELRVCQSSHGRVAVRVRITTERGGLRILRSSGSGGPGDGCGSSEAAAPQAPHAIRRVVASWGSLCVAALCEPDVAEAVLHVRAVDSA